MTPRTPAPLPRPHIWLALSALLSGCGSSAPEYFPAPSTPKKGVELPPGTVLKLAPPKQAPSEFILPEERLHLSGSNRTPLEVEGGSALGLIVRGRRIVYQRGEVKAALDVAPDDIRHSAPIPEHLGRGFLFWSTLNIQRSLARTMVYRANTWEGPLEAIVELPSQIDRISFGQKGAILQDARHIRKEFELPSGRARPLELPGLVHISTLPNKRSLALTDFGRVFVSPEGGDGFSERGDVRFGAPPRETAVRNGELWVVERTGRALRFDAGGQFVEDKLPALPPPAGESPKDPRWKHESSPRTLALRLGAPIDATTAMVAANGVVARVSLQSGEIIDAIRFPDIEKIECELAPANNDIIGVCKHKIEGPILIASGFLSKTGPKIEKSFDSKVAIYGNDEGELLAAAPCEGQKPDAWSGCRRSVDGQWQSFSVEASALEFLKRSGGAGSSAQNAFNKVHVRWLPISGSDPKAIVSSRDSSAIVLPINLKGDKKVPDPIVLEVNKLQLPFAILKSALERPRTPAQWIDRRFAAPKDGTIRGWLDSFGIFAAIHITAQGTVALNQAPGGSGLSFSTHGGKAIARLADGRLFQSLDFGEKWSPVLAPPFAINDEFTAFGRSQCSFVGCDLGVWLRVGWAGEDSAKNAPGFMAKRPPPLAQPPGLPLIACVPAGKAEEKSPPSSDSFVNSLGSLRFPQPPLRSFRASNFISKLVPNPILSEQLNEFAGPPRIYLNYPAAAEGQKPAAHIGYGIPFDTDGTLHTASLPFEHLGSSDLQIQTIAPILPANAKDSVSYFFTTQIPSRLIGTLSPVQGARILSSGAQMDPFVQSALVLPSKEFAVLGVSAIGIEHAFRISSDGKTISLLSGAPSETRETAPANPDVLAISSSGDLFVLRLPSGDEPASSANPALLLRIGGRVFSPGEDSGLHQQVRPVATLAPWSTLRNADDPACTGDPEGVRALIQTEGPWVRVEGRSLPAGPQVPPMTAIVRWNSRRVCLEAIELNDSPVEFGNGLQGHALIVARYLPKAEAMHVALTMGAIRTQPLSCSPVMAPR